MEMEKRLHEVALQGNVTNLKSLIQQDPLILDRVTPTYFLQDTPLHTSILQNHLDFALALLSHNPQLATEANSLGHLPLHVASAHGHEEIVRELLRVDPTSCMARTKDKGMVPLHLAIMNKVRAEIVIELVRASLESIRVRDDKGDSVYHLCAKYDNLDALQVLVEMLKGENDGSNLLNVKNHDGNTAFHLAVLHKNLEITKFMLATPGVEVNAVNNNGLTALDLVDNSPKDFKGLELLNLLLQSKVQKSTNKDHHSSLSQTKSSQPSKNKAWKTFFTFNDNNIKHLQDMKGELLVTAAIITAVTTLPTIYLRINQPDLLVDVYPINYVSFMPSVALIVLLLGGFPLSNKLCAWLVIQLMYSTIGFFGSGYIGAMISFESRYSKMGVALILMSIWFGLLMILSAINITRLIVLIVKSIIDRVKQRNLQSEHTQNVVSNS